LRLTTTLGIIAKKWRWENQRVTSLPRLATQVGGSGSCQLKWPANMVLPKPNPNRLFIGLELVTRTRPDCKPGNPNTTRWKRLLNRSCQPDTTQHVLIFFKRFLNAVLWFILFYFWIRPLTNWKPLIRPLIKLKTNSKLATVINWHFPKT
jgi:hypothetical protein